jgi:Tat protein secretion system quality control protein TatD with DNase activity
MQNSFEMETEAYKPALVDGHAHLDDLVDLPTSLQDAKEAGVIGIIGVGMDIKSNKEILHIAETNTRFVYPALGYHPWQITRYPSLSVFSSSSIRDGERKEDRESRFPLVFRLDCSLR